MVKEDTKVSFTAQVAALTQQKTEIGTLVSRMDHPVYVSYDGQGLVIAPRGVARKITKNLLGAIPKGLTFLPDNTK